MGCHRKALPRVLFKDATWVVQSIQFQAKGANKSTKFSLLAFETIRCNEIEATFAVQVTHRRSFVKVILSANRDRCDRCDPQKSSNSRRGHKVHHFFMFQVLSRRRNLHVFHIQIDSSRQSRDADRENRKKTSCTRERAERRLENIFNKVSIKR